MSLLKSLTEFEAVSVQEGGLILPGLAFRLVNCSRGTVYTLIAEGKLRTWRASGCQFVSVRELRIWQMSRRSRWVNNS